MKTLEKAIQAYRDPCLSLKQLTEKYGYTDGNETVRAMNWARCWLEAGGNGCDDKGRCPITSPIQTERRTALR
jgi:hypothetical protein